MRKHIYYLSLSLLILTTNFACAQAPEENLQGPFAESRDGVFAQEIKDLAERSSCIRYAWKDRGQAPAGYIKGVALSFARSLCRIKVSSATPPAAKNILSSPNAQIPNKDALAHYENVFEDLRINTHLDGAEPVRAIYALGIGLGMRETSGTYCEGWDVLAGDDRPSAAGEAGLFQVSYDSMAASEELRKLYQEYQRSPKRCLLDIFKEGAHCRPRGILGSGAAAVYQAFNKTCPAFAAEYAMTLLRIRRTHFGPINRREAEVAPACEYLLSRVQRLVESNPLALCKEIYL